MRFFKRISPPSSVRVLEHTDELKALLCQKLKAEWQERVESNIAAEQIRQMHAETAQKVVAISGTKKTLIDDGGGYKLEKELKPYEGPYLQGDFDEQFMDSISFEFLEGIEVNQGGSKVKQEALQIIIDKPFNDVCQQDRVFVSNHLHGIAVKFFSEKGFDTANGHPLIRVSPQ